MKNLLISFILISLLSSCSSNKAILSYMSQQEDKESSNKIVVFDKKVSIKQTLYTVSISNQSTNNGIVNYSRSKNYNSTDFTNLFRKYINDTLTDTWSSKDFKKFKIEIIDNSLEYLKKENSTMGFKKKNVFYAFSKPLFYKNKRLILFYVSKAFNIGSIEFSGVVVMKKTNGKWEIIETINSKELY